MVCCRASSTDTRLGSGKLSHLQLQTMQPALIIFRSVGGSHMGGNSYT
jgi:hypothetical protein